MGNVRKNVLLVKIHPASEALALKLAWHIGK